MFNPQSIELKLKGEITKDNNFSTKRQKIFKNMIRKNKTNIKINSINYYVLDFNENLKIVIDFDLKSNIKSRIHAIYNEKDKAFIDDVTKEIETATKEFNDIIISGLKTIYEKSKNQKLNKKWLDKLGTFKESLKQDEIPKISAYYYNKDKDLIPYKEFIINQKYFTNDLSNFLSFLKNKNDAVDAYLCSLKLQDAEFRQNLKYKYEIIKETESILPKYLDNFKLVDEITEKVKPNESIKTSTFILKDGSTATMKANDPIGLMIYNLKSYLKIDSFRIDREITLDQIKQIKHGKKLLFEIK